MNRIPPNLLYLTIYNPTLLPTGPIDGDNEDAEEQAQILFYTSKERAVSRDRMLRQIGLAKALINFAELFNVDDACDNVHSQSKRMIMISPEPDFWIHAGVEVAKVLRPINSKDRSKVKAKGAEKGKGNDVPPLYDYDDGSVHDNALRAHILRGYERFKLTHGSFTSILETLGQQALELQLERFWTVWSWSWDLEERIDFSEQFGPLLHPLFNKLVPLVEGFSDALSDEIIPVVLSRSHIIPSERYTEGRYPAAVAAHLSLMIPPPIEQSCSSDTLNALASSVDTIKGKLPLERKGSSNTTHVGEAGTFLGMNMNMDVKKWGWPGYLTFGKGNSSKPSLEATFNVATEKDKPDTASVNQQVDQERTGVQVEVNVNASDLEDAISSDSRSMASGARNTINPYNTQFGASSVGLNQTDELVSQENQAINDIQSASVSSLIPSDPPEDSPPPSPPPPPLPEFSLTRLNIAPFQEPTKTRKTTVHYWIKGEFLLALLEKQDSVQETEASNLQIAAERATKLIDDLESTIYDAGLKSISDSLPSANKILQPQDRYLLSTGVYTHGSPGFVSTSSHLFNAKTILDTYPEVTEVFSRGQNPQHWHVAKRGLSNSQNTDVSTIGSEEAVFMEVFRKETSLTDVDNLLAGLVKKSGIVDGSGQVRI